MCIIVIIIRCWRGIWIRIWIGIWWIFLVIFRLFILCNLTSHSQYHSTIWIWWRNLILFIWVISTAIIPPTIRTRIISPAVIWNWSIWVIRILPLTTTILSGYLLIFFWFLIVNGLFNLCRFVTFKLSNSIHSIYIELIHNLLISHLNSLHFGRVFVSSLLFIR